MHKEFLYSQIKQCHGLNLNCVGEPMGYFFSELRITYKFILTKFHAESLLMLNFIINSWALVSNQILTTRHFNSFVQLYQSLYTHLYELMHDASSQNKSFLPAYILRDSINACKAWPFKLTKPLFWI